MLAILCDTHATLPPKGGFLMSEAQEQEAVIEWCDWKHIPIFAIPNGGKRDAREAAHMKRQGVRAGVPDLCVPVARGGFHGLYIEMKVGKNKPTDKQLVSFLLTNSQRSFSFLPSTPRLPPSRPHPPSPFACHPRALSPSPLAATCPSRAGRKCAIISA